LQVGLEKYAEIGGWNDPDMLEVGNGKLTYSESLAHFSLWCLLKAPLLIGCDVNKISKESLEILSNEELIGINQDPLGVQGSRIKSESEPSGKKEVWAGPLSNNRHVVIFFNQGDIEASINVSIKKELKIDFESYTQRDPVRHKEIEA
jgi:alpha-galactosidase